VFLIFHALFMLGLVWFTPGYIPPVWNLAALSGVIVGGIPLEELFFGFTFGWYWTGVYGESPTTPAAFPCECLMITRRSGEPYRDLRRPSLLNQATAASS